MTTYFKPPHGQRLHELGTDGRALCGRPMVQGSLRVDATMEPIEAYRCTFCKRAKLRALAPVEIRSPNPAGKIRFDRVALWTAINRTGYTPDAIGGFTGVSGKQIYKWLHGKSTPGVLALARVCAWLGLPIGECLYSDDEQAAKRAGISFVKHEVVE